MKTCRLYLFKHWGIIITSLLLNSTLTGQIMCPLDDSLALNVGSNLMTICDGSGTYPYEYTDFFPVSTTVVKTIKMKFVILQNTAKDFNGNFESSTETTKFFNDALADMNSRYSNLQTEITCDLPDPNDTKIQFSHILDFLEDPSGTGSYWDNPTSGGINAWCPAYGSYDLDPLLSDEMEYINVFFTEDECYFEYIVNAIPCATGPAIVSCSDFPKFDNMDYISQVNMRGFFTSYYDKKYNGGTWPGTYWDATETTYHSDNRYWWAVEALGKTLTHELGHSIDLHHVSPSVPCYSTRIMNNTGAATKTYLDEEEVGQANRSLYISSVKKYIADCPIDNTNDLVIDGDETWEYDITLYSDLIINSGASLTIRCKVSMPTDAEIIVKNGAALIVDGGYITKSCEGLWQGIQVWGVGSGTAHPTVNDIKYGYYPTSYLDHGVVYIKEGSVIEYAREAISTSNLDEHYNPDFWGGIVIAHGASFINCRRAIEFMQYDHSPSETDDDNISEFMWCNFEINDNYPCEELFYAHISMWDVDGVVIVGSTFKDLRGICTNTGTGVYSIDATYLVASDLCYDVEPCDDIIGSFEGFTRAIWVENANYRPRNIEVSDILFTNNYRGILFSNVQNSLVMNNTFEVQDQPDLNCYGLYLEDCTNYHVENNEFTTFGSITSSSPYNGGIYVVNNSSTSTELYRNFFQGIEAGVRVQNTNSGLQIKCNTFTSVVDKHDIYVTNTGTLQNQGTCPPVVVGPEIRVNAPAGNIFSYDCNSSTGDIKVYDGFGELKYKHLSNTGHGPSCYTTGVTTYVNPIDCGWNSPLGGYSACQSKLPPGGSGYRLDEAIQITAASIMEEVSLYTDAIEELIVMADAADNVQEFELEENSYSEDLDYLTHERDLRLYKAVNLYLLEDKADSALFALNDFEDDLAVEMKVKIYLTQGDYTNAYKELSELNLANVSSYDFFILNEVLIGLYAAGKSINDLNESQFEQISSIAGKQSPAGVAAENIIHYLSGNDSEEVFDPESENEEKVNFNSSSNISIYPNPTGQYLYINSSFYTDQPYRLEIYNLNGELIQSFQIGSTGLTTIDVSQIPSGLIFIRIMDNLDVVFTEKIIVK